MASVSPTIADFRLNSSFQVNYINFGWTVTNHVSGTVDKTFDFSAIPTGSTINSATLYSTTTLGNYHLRHLFLNVNGAGYENFYDISGGVRYKDVKAAVQTLVTAGTKSITIGYKFGATSNSPSSLGTGTKSTYMDFADNSIVISYTAPYSKCTAPTTVTVSPTSTGKSKTASLSWSGAGNGTNNTVNGYDIYHSTTSATSGFSFLKSSTTSPTSVTSSATNGGKIYYKIVAKGTAGSSYYSDMSSKYATLTTTWTDATAPNSVTGPTNVVMNTSQTISWSGAAGGTNNPITGYEVYYSGDSYAAPIATTNASTTTATVTSHATNGSSYIYKVKVIAELNSAFSSDTHTMKSYVGAITAPSSVSFGANNLAPGGTTSLSWSGQAGGTNNAITGYEIQTSPNNSTWTKLADDSASPYSPVTASTTNNATVYFRVKVKGQRSDAYSSSVGLVTKVTKPNPPSSVSLNDSNLPVGWSVGKTLSWSGASAGTYNNAIYGYRVMVSTNGGALTQYGSDVVTGYTYGSMPVTSLAANGTQKFYVHTVGATTVAAEKLSAQSTAYDTLTTTVTNPTAPTVSIPTNVAPGSTQSLSWSGAQNGTNNNITTYKIYEKIDSGAWAYKASDATSPYTVTASSSNGGTKSYYLVSDGPHGDSGNSNTVVMTTTVSKPNAPTSLTLSASSNLAPDTDITLAWTGASNATYNNPVNGYRVMRSINGGTYAALGADLPKTTTSLSVKTYNGNGTHAFRVIALGTNLGIHSDMSSKIATATTVVSTPSAPSVVEVVNGGGVAPGAVRKLKWSGAKAGTYNNPIKGYQVYRSSSPDSGYTAFGSAILTTNTYYEMNVEAPSADGATYYYKVATLGNTLSINSAMSSAKGILTTAKLPSTGTLNKTSVTATGSESVTVTISPQLTTYKHEVTWYINGTYTSGVRTKSAGVTTDTYTIPQSWIAGTALATSAAAKCKVETFDGTTSLGVKEYSFTVNVPSKSTFTVSGVPLTATGSASATVNISSKYAGYKHTVVWSTTGYSQTHNVAAGTATQAYAIPKSWCNSVPNAESFTVTVKVTTIKVTSSGDLNLGYNTNTFIANVPSDVLPSITSFEPTGVDQKWDLYVRTKSKVKWTPVAQGSYSSTIVSYKITNPNLNSGVLPYSAGTSWTSGTLNYSGTQAFSLEVTDSRGRKATTSDSVVVTNYNSPSVASAAFTRADSDGTLNRANGTYINLTASFSFSNIGTNAITANAYYKEIGTATWLPSAGATVTISGTGSSRLGSVTFGSNTINIAKLYDVKVSLTDDYSTVTVSNIVPTVSRVFDFRNDRAALGGIAAIADSFQVPLGWKMYADGNKEVFHDGRTVPIANGGTGATTAATARTNLGITLTNLGVTATATELNYVDGVTSAIQTQLNGKAASSHGTHVPTPQTANNAIYLRNDNTWQTITAAEIGAAASSHSHSYLPLAGGTLTGAINVQSTGASWLSGKTYGAVNALKQSSGSYHPVIRVESYAGNVFTLGGLGESVGFYGFYKDRTVNGTDWNFVVNTGTGNWSTNGSITASSFSGSLAWSNLTGVPSSFTPSTHTHSYLSLSGGTLSGSITLPGSVVLAKDASYNALRISNPSGYLQVGPLNTGTCHLYTDRASFYFNKGLIVNGTTVSMDGHTHAYAATSHTHAYANSQGRVVTDYNHADFRVSGMYGESGAATNTPSGSYKALIVAANSDVGLQITGGYTTDNLYFRGWHSSGGTYTAWRTVLHSGNYNSYAPTKTGTGASGTWGISITGNAATATTASACSGNAATASNSSKLGGLSLGNATQGSHPGANTVVRTDANGYLNVGWINTVSGSASDTPTRIYCSQDAYLRYYAPDNATLRRSLKAYITYGTATASGGNSGDIYIKHS